MKYRYATATAAVRATLLKGGWWTGPEMRVEVKKLTGKWFSESGITARIRQVRDEFAVPSRPKKGSSSYEYRLQKAA